jgi:hypothetical protein
LSSLQPASKQASKPWEVLVSSLLYVLQGLLLLLAALEEEESSSFHDPRPWLWLVIGIIRVGERSINN